MDVVPEGGVRDHLVVTSRWPGERQLGDSSLRRGGREAWAWYGGGGQ
jgi:hypothetical protein